jgi:hypothetical protein
MLIVLPEDYCSPIAVNNRREVVMTISSTRATVYAVLFGLLVAINVYLWVDASEQWRALLAFVGFACSMGLLKASLTTTSSEHMSEHDIKTLGAEE